MFIVSIARRAVLGELDVCCPGALTILLGKEGVHCRCGKLGWAGCSLPIQVVSSVTMLVRGGSLAKSMPHYPVSQIESHQKVMVLTRSTVVAVTRVRPALRRSPHRSYDRRYPGRVGDCPLHLYRRQAAYRLHR